MTSVLAPIAALLFGVALLLLGSGLQGTLLGIRGAIEAFSPTMIGLVMTAYYGGFALGCLFNARVIERVGHIRTFAAFASLASAAAIVFPVFVEPWSWLALRVVTGFCFAGLYMAIESWLNGRVSNESRGRLLAVYMIVNLGSIAAAQQLLNLADPAGFILFVLSSVLISLALVPVALTTSAAPAPVPTGRMGLGELYLVSPLAVVGAFAIGLVNGAMWGLIPLAAIQTGSDTAEVAAFMSVIVLGGVALQWPVGRLSDMLDRRHVLIGASLVLLLSSVALFGLPESDRMVVMALGFVLGGMNLVIYPLCAAHINDRIVHEDLVQANATLLLVLGVGAAVGPVLGGIVMDGFGPLSVYLYMAAVSAVFALFGLYRLRQADATPEDEQVAFEPVGPAPTTPVLDPRIDPDEIGPPS
ncbi:MAG: MFS transporter [Alphaproteobacteria bacterium]|nr:MFS transporter [Alphaproteobacteria bacterium]